MGRDERGEVGRGKRGEVGRGEGRSGVKWGGEG